MKNVNAASAPLPRTSELRTRILSGIVLIPLTLLLLYLGGWFYVALLVLAAMVCVWEWVRISGICRIKSWGGRFWTVLWGVVYLTPAFIALAWLRFLENGFWLVLCILAIVWATDTGAYALGRTLGGPKLAPRFSPKKTWSGLLGGMVCAFGAAIAFSVAGTIPWSWSVSGILGAGLAIIAQIGDLFESWLKRRVNVKDSGNLIPGHGGMLDRIDGVLFAAPIYAVLVLFLR